MGGHTEILEWQNRDREYKDAIKLAEKAAKQAEKTARRAALEPGDASAPGAGLVPDAAHSGEWLCWWDGQQWTERTAPVHPQSAQG